MNVKRRGGKMAEFNIISKGLKNAEDITSFGGKLCEIN